MNTACGWVENLKRAGESGNEKETQKKRNRREKTRTEEGPFGRPTERIPHLLEQSKQSITII